MTARIVTATSLFVLSLIAGRDATAKDLATIDGKPLTDAEVEKAADGLGVRAKMMLENPTLRRQFIDHVIDTRLLSKAALDLGLDKSEEFKRRLEEARIELLASFFQKHHISENTTDEKLKAYFEKDKTRFSKKEIRVLHIILPDEAKARAVLQEAKNPGTDFEALAKQYSTGPSGAKGGDLGFFSRGRMVPEFEAAAFKTPKGVVHAEPVKTGFGWHVLKVVDERGSDEVSFDGVKADVREQLERDLKDSLIKELRAKAKVVIDERAVRAFE